MSNSRKRIEQAAKECGFTLDELKWYKPENVGTDDEEGGWCAIIGHFAESHIKADDMISAIHYLRHRKFDPVSGKFMDGLG